MEDSSPSFEKSMFNISMGGELLAMTVIECILYSRSCQVLRSPGLGALFTLLLILKITQQERHYQLI